MKVMLVENDKNLTTVLKMEFDFNGIDLKDFDDPTKALEYDNEIDHIILDQKLGEYNGLDFIEAFKAKWPKCKITILTGHGSITSTVEAIKKGADDYLIKPISFPLLLATIKGNRKDIQDVLENEEMSLERKEREHIEFVLGQCDGNISKAAKILGLHRQSLQRKLKKYTPK